VVLFINTYFCDLTIFVHIFALVIINFDFCKKKFKYNAKTFLLVFLMNQETFLTAMAKYDKVN